MTAVGTSSSPRRRGPITTKSNLGHDGAPVMFKSGNGGYGFRARAFARPGMTVEGFGLDASHRPGMTGVGCDLAFSRHLASEFWHRRAPSFGRRAQGKPGAGCTRSPVCNGWKAHECSHHRFTANVPAFPARWFYGLFRALPGDRLVCHRRLRVTRRLDASIGAPGPHGLTSRPFYRCFCRFSTGRPQ
jgi:hypothetical protein